MVPSTMFLVGGPRAFEARATGYGHASDTEDRADILHRADRAGPTSPMLYLSVDMLGRGHELRNKDVFRAYFYRLLAFWYDDEGSPIRA